MRLAPPSGGATVDTSRYTCNNKTPRSAREDDFKRTRDRVVGTSAGQPDVSTNAQVAARHNQLHAQTVPQVLISRCTSPARTQDEGPVLVDANLDKLVCAAP
jgi:hypothetical protein